MIRATSVGVVLMALALCGCQKKPPTAQEIENTRRIAADSNGPMGQEMSQFVQNRVTILCINGTQYMGWADGDPAHLTHHLAALYRRGYVQGCTGGVDRDLDNPPPVPADLPAGGPDAPVAHEPVRRR